MNAIQTVRKASPFGLAPSTAPMKVPNCPTCAEPLRRLGLAPQQDGSIVDCLLWFHCPRCRAQFSALFDNRGLEIRGIDLVRESAKESHRPC